MISEEAIKRVDVATHTAREAVHHVLILVHGIRDSAEWQTNIAKELAPAAIHVVGIKYGFFDLLRFLFPFSLFRRQVVSHLAKKVRETKQLFPNAKLSFLGHSFGSYVICRMLLEDPTLIAHRIIFCGSVLSQRAPISQLRSNYSAPVVNEVGTRDLFPLLAASSTWGYGSAGSLGFGQPHVVDRWHDADHSDYLDPAFAKKYWVPFIADDRIVESGPVEMRRPWLKILLERTSIKHVVTALLLVAAGYFLWDRPDLACTEKWLSAEAYNRCFHQKERVGTYPVNVMGRRSYLGIGPDEFHADWIGRPGTLGFFCPDSRSRMSPELFEQQNVAAIEAGYQTASVHRFRSAGGVDLVQATWVFQSPDSNATCPPLPLDG